jgi:hypothetical protein
MLSFLESPLSLARGGHPARGFSLWQHATAIHTVATTIWKEVLFARAEPTLVRRYL